MTCYIIASCYLSYIVTYINCYYGLWLHINVPRSTFFSCPVPLKTEIQTLLPFRRQSRTFVCLAFSSTPLTGLCSVLSTTTYLSTGSKVTLREGKVSIYLQINGLCSPLGIKQPPHPYPSTQLKVRNVSGRYVYVQLICF